MNFEDYSGRIQDLTGRLCWFREPPGIRAIVQVVDVSLARGHRTATLRVIASAARSSKMTLDPGTLIEVSASVTGGWNQLWLIHPLNACTIDEALGEIAAAHPEETLRWVR